MKIGCIQLDIKWEDQESNYSISSALIKKASNKGCKLVCLPELFSTGITMSPSKFAESLKGPTCTFLSQQAKSNKIHLLGSFIEENGRNLPRNSVAMFCPDGSILGKYSKNHVFTFGDENKHYSNGNGISMFKIEDFNIVPFICYDLRFPELFRITLNHGTNVFVIPSNWPNPRKDHWVTLLKARAIENQSYVVGINRVGNSPSQSFFGSSMIVSPKGEVVNQAGDKEEVLVGEIEIGDILEWRSSFKSLDDRRNDYYRSINKVSMF